MRALAQPMTMRAVGVVTALVIVVSCGERISWLSVAWGNETGSESYSDAVSRLWLEGKKAEARALAEERLDEDPNDLAGLLVQLDYEVAFLEMEKLKGTLSRVRDAARAASGDGFERVRPLLLAQLETIELVMSDVTPQIVQEERHKALVSGKPLPTQPFLEALEEDAEESARARGAPRPDHRADSREDGAGAFLLAVFATIVFLLAGFFLTRRLRRSP